MLCFYNYSDAAISDHLSSNLALSLPKLSRLPTHATPSFSCSSYPRLRLSIRMAHLFAISGYRQLFILLRITCTLSNFVFSLGRDGYTRVYTGGRHDDRYVLLPPSPTLQPREDPPLGYFFPSPSSTPSFLARHRPFCIQVLHAILLVTRSRPSMLHALPTARNVTSLFQNS